MKQISLLMVMAGLAVSAQAARPKPNVVLIVTDDLGWQDLKCYDIDEPSPMETPNLDAFAQKGVQFRQAYSPAPTCSPSRCAIISGNHPARAQKTHVVGGCPPYARSPRTRMMDPWYSGRMPEDTYTLARAVKQNGYVAGHVGKWHIAINHHAFPQPMDVGFDWTRSNRGAHTNMKDRLTGFATDAEDDPYRLDENGFPFDQNNADALDFVHENKDRPFFLYYCPWLVHSPIMTRSEALLQKYAEKLGVDPKDKISKETPGQVNPFYCAMVEMLDYYMGRFFHYLETTDDPRWPGHKLSENTYIIFTSDNGGMEGSSERYTDNAPLDLGKISAKEGGTRVPLLIAGPGIAKGLKSDVMVNGLDFYPTILALTGSRRPEDKNLDGCDISTLLLKDPSDPALVRMPDGKVRDTLMWHFPHGVALESTIRIGDYKLIRNYDYVGNDGTPELELFRLYENGKRADIEEAVNLADKLPEKTALMNQRLTEMLTAMEASYPCYNPLNKDLPGQDKVCTVESHTIKGRRVDVSFRENGAKIVRVDLIYTLNGGDKYEEWFRRPAELGNGKASVELPEGTTHYYINLIDENRFLVCYPEQTGGKGGFIANALSATQQTAAVSPKTLPELVAGKDVNNDGMVTEDEYVGHFASGFERKDKNSDGVLSREEQPHKSFDAADQNKDGKLTREEFMSTFHRQFKGQDRNGDGVITAADGNG